MKSPKLVVKRVPGFRVSGRFFFLVAALACGGFVCAFVSSYNGATISNAAVTYDSIPNAVPHPASPDATGILSNVSPAPDAVVDGLAAPSSVSDPEDSSDASAPVRVRSLGQAGRGQPWGNGMGAGPGGNGGRNNGGGNNPGGGGMFPGGGGGNGQGGVYIAPEVRLSPQSNDQLNKRQRTVDSIRPATNSFSD
jgi:hypothetical protein